MDLILIYLACGVLFSVFAAILADITQVKRQERRDQIVIKNIVKSLDDTTLIR